MINLYDPKWNNKLPLIRLGNWAKGMLKGDYFCKAREIHLGLFGENMVLMIKSGLRGTY